MSRPIISVTALVFGSLITGMMFSISAVKAETGFQSQIMAVEDLLIANFQMNEGVS